MHYLIKYPQQYNEKIILTRPEFLEKETGRLSNLSLVTQPIGDRVGI